MKDPGLAMEITTEWQRVELGARVPARNGWTSPSKIDPGQKDKVLFFCHSEQSAGRGPCDLSLSLGKSGREPGKIACAVLIVFWRFAEQCLKLRCVPLWGDVREDGRALTRPFCECGTRSVCSREIMVRRAAWNIYTWGAGIEEAT